MKSYSILIIIHALGLLIPTYLFICYYYLLISFHQFFIPCYLLYLFFKKLEIELKNLN